MFFFVAQGHQKWIKSTLTPARHTDPQIQSVGSHFRHAFQRSIVYERDILYSDKYLHDIPHKPAATSTDEAISITLRETADIMRRIREAGVFFSLDRPRTRCTAYSTPERGREDSPGTGGRMEHRCRRKCSTNG
jgi:hypothetical protein